MFQKQICFSTRTDCLEPSSITVSDYPQAEWSGSEANLEFNFVFFPDLSGLPALLSLRLHPLARRGLS